MKNTTISLTHFTRSSLRMHVPGKNADESVSALIKIYDLAKEQILCKVINNDELSKYLYNFFYIIDTRCTVLQCHAMTAIMAGIQVEISMAEPGSDWLKKLEAMEKIMRLKDDEVFWQVFYTIAKEFIEQQGSYQDGVKLFFSLASEYEEY